MLEYKQSSCHRAGTQRLYATQDANYNVTALIGTDGYVKQRFQYTPYGQRTVLSANWTATTDAYGFLYGHQGGRTDPATGLIHFRNRETGKGRAKRPRGGAENTRTGDRKIAAEPPAASLLHRRIRRPAASSPLSPACFWRIL